ncbi:hypothetical protein [Micromonospora sp. IBHARD004]|uniref:hypothetical protein n=1 Tax=Micromonospora sp. IBHARD004 TaxID=3457764 RepID=UPI0040599F39
MSWDEERAGKAVRRVLTRAPVPPSGVDVGAVLRSVRRADRRRRRLTVALAAVAVLAVGGGSVVVLGRDGRGHGLAPVTGRPSAKPTETRPAPTVVPVTVTMSGTAASCTFEQYPVPQEAWFPRVVAADASGRILIGTAGVSNKAVDRLRSYLVRWVRGEPSLHELPKRVPFTPIAVNASGLVVGWGDADDNKPGVPRLYQDGQLSDLRLPPGYDGGRALAVNDRGDVLGVAYRATGGAPVVWSAGSDQPPRVFGAPGSYNVLGWTRDGTIVGIETVQRGGAKTDRKVRLWRTDGSIVVMPAPAGWAPGGLSGDQSPLRGDWVAGIIPGTGRSEKSPPAMWNIRTGTLFVYHGLDTRNHFSVVAGPDGRLLVGVPGGGWRLVERDGAARPVPLPAGSNPEYGPQPVLIDDAGSILGAVRAEPPGENRPTVWRCS